MYECTFVCKRFCFNFAATAHTHSHNHCHMERCSFNDIGVFVCKIQKTRPAPFHLPQSSIDHMTGTRDHYDYLLMLSASLGNGSRGCRGRGRAGVAECVDLTLLPANDTIDAAQAMPMPCIHLHTYTHTIVHMVRLEICTDPATQRQRLNGRVSRLRLQRRESHVFLCSSFVAHFGSTRPQSGPTRQSALALSVGFARYKSSRAKNCAFNRARQLLQ